LIDVTPAYACLALHVDVALIGGEDPLASARAWLVQWLERTRFDAGDTDVRTIEIPVAYDDEYGSDLATVAAHAGMATEDVVAHHTSAIYSVAMLGFAPGFPYLFGLDPALAIPRLTTPRTHVAAGSVGIGGAQTGIYPQSGPGGWRLIGRTPLRLFDAQRDPPSLLQAGDRVRFVAIDAATFAAMDEHAR
jgi:KipI family sensor histidine kinase inhibitor